MKCVVQSNCRNSFDCDFCSDYSDYQPIEPTVRSPRQLREIAERKAAKKAAKDPERTKRIRAAKRHGKAAEKGVANLFTRWGFESGQVLGSGMFKGVNVVGASEDFSLESDVHLYIDGKRYLVESKYRADLKTYYRYAADGGTKIDGFCYIVDMEKMHQFLNGFPIGTDKEIPDLRLKKLHRWFEQDNASFVAMKQGKQPFIFAISMETIKTMKRG